MVNFYFDRIIDGKPYPNLAKHQALPYTPEWREFSKKWPFSEPVHFLEYLDQEHIEYQIVTTPENAIYPISVSFFDFSVKWFDLMNSAILDALKAKTIKLWFLYSEGDNPQRIQQHLFFQAANYNIPVEQIHFTSANSSANNLEHCSYFADDELLYRLRNTDDPIKFHTQPRSKKFTALVRTHKWWRANVMTELWKDNLHCLGYFSYNTHIDIGEQECNNPITPYGFFKSPSTKEIYFFSQLPELTKEFINSGPFKADQLNSDNHNLYSTTVEEHYSDSYLNIILETHFDADQSGGTFLTEKTFKPLKNSQIFILFGPAGSIEQLKEMGYCTFDHVIDHNYDSVEDNTTRWFLAVQEAKRLIRHESLHELYIACKDGILHNQQLFLQSKSNRLNTLLQKVIK